jgi:hypothetical protein
VTDRHAQTDVRPAHENEARFYLGKPLEIVSAALIVCEPVLGIASTEKPLVV